MKECEMIRISTIKFSLIMLIGFYQNAVYAQQILNFDFEKTSIERTVKPWGWNKKTFAATEISMDSLTKFEGKYSFRMSYDLAQENDRMQTMSFGIEPHQLYEKTITIKGRIKTKELAGSAYLSISDSDKSSPIKEVDSISEKISNTTDWQDVSISFFVQPSIRAVYFKLHHQGEGTAWFDDFSLIVDGREFDEVGVADPFSKKQLEWIEDASHRIVGVDATPYDSRDVTSFEDLRLLKKLVNNAQIIALGESTHGSSEFFRLKHRILEYSIKELGVRIFGIEGNQLTVENINKYVLGGEGTAKSSMSGIFSVWYNEEVLNMIKWTRNYNDQHPDDKVEFAGYDMQNLSSPMDSLYRFLEKRSPELLETTSELLKNLKKDGNNYFMISDSIKLEWFENSVKVLEKVRSYENQWLTSAKSGADSLEVNWGIQYANLVKQFAENAYRGHLSFYRDAAMAENISWILSMRKTETRILIWAHDFHISRGEHPNKKLNIYGGLSMGSHLSKKYGESYKAFAISTYEGEYWAMVGYRDFRQVKCPLHNSPKGTLDEALHQITLKKKSLGLLLDLSKARHISWLTKATPMRFANHVNIEYGYWTRYSIPYQFDGIFFIDKTTSAKQLSKNN